MDDNGAGERTLRGGPWAWCLSCSFPSGAPVTVRYSVWRKRWECLKCKRAVDMLKCDKCGFEGGDATQLPAPKRPWGFQVMIKNGHKKVCPRCGDISVYPVEGERPSGDEIADEGSALSECSSKGASSKVASASPEGQSPAAASESGNGMQGEPASQTKSAPIPAVSHETPAPAETAGDKIKRYRFHWRDGRTNDGQGTSPEQALTLLGFGFGAVPALDYWEELLSPQP